MPDNYFGLPHFGRLTQQQLERLHEASLTILERTGVRFDEEEALGLFRKAGADVDGTLVRIPARLVEWAVDTAPKSITIYDQTGQPAMELREYQVYFGVGSDCRHIYDLETGERREALLDDVVQGVRLVDALPHIDFVMSMFMPTDVETGTHEPHQMAIMLRETTKPIIFVGEAGKSTIAAVEMKRERVR
jgi:trimethylamine--corrinoid protein Co-methyltransferase